MAADRDSSGMWKKELEKKKEVQKRRYKEAEKEKEDEQPIASVLRRRKEVGQVHSRSGQCHSDSLDIAW